MRNEKDDLIALANLLITNLDAKEHGHLIERWLCAVTDGPTEQDIDDVELEYSDYDIR